LIFLCCNAEKEHSLSVQGVIKYKGEFFDTAATFLSKPVFVDELKVWFKDSFAIEEIRTRSFITDTANKTRIEESVLYYIFMDLQENTYTYYKTFSDTTRSFRRYTTIDSFRSRAGWDFSNANATEFKGESFEMPDTVINSIKYKRIRKLTTSGKDPYNSIGYFRCDKQGTLFKFDKHLSDSMGCPLVRVDDIPIKKGSIKRGEIIFFIDSLSTEELKVFAAWEKNEREMPVKK